MWVWLLSSTMATAAPCDDGQRRTVIARECCWPGQHWSIQNDACVGIPRKCPNEWSVQLGPPDLPRAAICDHISPSPFQLDADGELLGLPGRVDAWGADPRLGPALVWGDPDISGDMAKYRIDDVLRSHREALSYCADIVRSDQPTATGVVRVRWRIDSAGRSGSVRVTQSTLRSFGARSCFAHALRDMTFSPPVSGSVRVAYSFVVGDHP